MGTFRNTRRVGHTRQDAAAAAEAAARGLKTRAARAVRAPIPCPGRARTQTGTLRMMSGPSAASDGIARGCPPP
jgi:hypothetical protein